MQVLWDAVGPVQTLFQPALPAARPDMSKLSKQRSYSLLSCVSREGARGDFKGFRTDAEGGVRMYKEKAKGTC